MSDTPNEELSQAERMRRSNKEMWQEWSIDVDQDPNDIPLEKLNPGHPALWEANKALPYFDRIRREDPLHRCEESQFGPYWSVTKYQDIMYVERNHKIFSSDSRKGGIQLGGVADPDPDPTFHLPMFIMEDPPKHDEQRKVVAPMFTQRHLITMEGLIRERAGKILDELPRNEEFNWVRKVSVELTGQMLATLFGVPQEDRHKLVHWSDVSQSIGDPDVFETPEAGFAELWKCWEYFDAVWKERKAETEPGQDLISMLVHGESTKDMPPNEYLGNVLLLIVGGNDTTRNSITGGLLALNQFPDQYEKLIQNPGLVDTMAPEIIRWQSPVAHMARTALEDHEIRGKKIREGDKLAMWYVSGNRDEDDIDNPYQFVIDRANPRNHLSFGFGIHRCLGNRLGEMQLRIIWEEILKRFGKIEVTGDPVYLKSSFIRGIKELPVTIRA
ncbi:MAG TPA: cytochrome P450 [Pseudomonadales bacterium]|nr:cytochrome P450 [Pseudomonadales bacterium]